MRRKQLLTPPKKKEHQIKMKSIGRKESNIENNSAGKEWHLEKFQPYKNEHVMDLPELKWLTENHCKQCESKNFSSSKHSQKN